MFTKKPLTQNTALLLVAHGFGRAFEFSELVVECWKAYPEMFGLRGFPFPDAHRVSCCLSIESGPVKQGLIDRKNGHFVVSEEGAKQAEAFLSKQPLLRMARSVRKPESNPEIIVAQDQQITEEERQAWHGPTPLKAVLLVMKRLKVDGMLARALLAEHAGKPREVMQNVW